MPIPKSAVDKYLARELDTRTWIKNLLPLEVEEELSYIKPAPRFHCPLRTDQKIMFLLGLAHPETLFLTDLGTGKTSVSLELLTYFYENGFMRRGFVFCPTDEISEGWVDEIHKWNFNIPFVRLVGPTKDKWDILNSLKNGIAVGTYIGIAAMVSKLVHLVDTNGKTLDKRKRQVQDRPMLSITENCDAIVLDQSTKIGNPESLSFEVCKEFSQEAQLRFALAGRAFGRDPFVLFTQFLLTDQGRAFGRSAGMFREAFFRRVRNPWGTTWTVRKRREPLLAEFVAASSIRYSIEECVELPPKVPITKEVEFPDENWTYYDRVREELLAAKGNFKEIKNNFLRMRQISSGFVGFKDDETGERAQIEFEENPKLNLLMELVQEVPPDRKLVIFHEFTFSGSRICQELAKLKLRHGWLWGGTKDWTAIKEAFNNDPDFRIIVANHRKASMGLNLQSANYLFYYESPVSSIDRYESEGRIYRTGQKHKSMIYDVIIKDSADQRILDFHTESRDLFRSLVENPAKYFGKSRR